MGNAPSEEYQKLKPVEHQFNIQEHPRRIPILVSKPKSKPKSNRKSNLKSNPKSNSNSKPREPYYFVHTSHGSTCIFKL